MPLRILNYGVEPSTPSPYMVPSNTSLLMPKASKFHLTFWPNTSKENKSATIRSMILVILMVWEMRSGTSFLPSMHPNGMLYTLTRKLRHLGTKFLPNSRLASLLLLVIPRRTYLNHHLSLSTRPRPFLPSLPNPRRR